MARAPRVLVFAVCFLAGCTAAAGHPVRLSLPRLAPGQAAPVVTGIEEPASPDAASAGGFLFHGLGGVLKPLETLHARPMAVSRDPIIAALPRMEAAVLARYRGGGFGGSVRAVVVVAATGHVPLTPAEIAELMMDAEVERRVLEADVFQRVGTEYALPGARRGRYLVELRRQGKGPLRFDLRFGLAAERWDLPDGRILMRYDPRPELRPKHVTLYRGGAIIDPTAGGARLTEILILGTDISVPFFLVGEMLNMSRSKLTKRAKGLWAVAWQGR